MNMTKAIATFALLVALAAGAGCQPQVEVRTGTKTVCSYGHPVSNDTTTVRVPAKDAGKYSVKTVTVVCPQHLRAVELYRQAQAAIAAGDLKAAEQNLKQVVALDAGFRQAAAQLDTIAKGEKPTPDTSVPAASPPSTSTPDASKPGEGDTSSPAASLLKWAPDVVNGFTAEKPTIDVFGIAREYAPSSGSKAATLVIVADQEQTPAGAKSALQAQVKDHYTKNVDTVKAGGHTAYFGTDGRRFAALGLTEGSVVIVLESSAKSGDSPAELKQTLIDVLEQLP